MVLWSSLCNLEFMVGMSEAQQWSECGCGVLGGFSRRIDRIYELKQGFPTSLDPRLIETNF